MVLLLSLLAVSSCAVEADAGPPVSQALLSDAEAYGDAQGIPLDEAIRRLRQQDPVGELSAVLQEREADVFGGLWIEGQPEYKVIVLLTGDQRRVLRRYVGGTSLEGVVELRDAAVTLETLEAAQATAMRMLKEVGSRADTGIDVQNNCVSLYVANPETLQRELGEAGLELPELVCLTVTGPYAEAPPLDPPPGVVFPRQHPPESLAEEMQALMIGELVEAGGCLRVAGDGQDHLIIWPYDHAITAAEDGALQVRDGSGMVIAQVGDAVRMSGGEVPSAQSFTATDIPDTCGEPYWLAGSEIERVHEE
jgi:hypothetical protein